jgi:hypothetical protein
VPVAQVALTRVPVLPFPEASAVVVPFPSSIFHNATGVGPALVGDVMVKAIVVDAETPDPVAVMTALELPVVAAAEVVRVSVVVQVRVQLEEENEAVTPAGKAEVVNDTGMALPESSVAVRPSAAALPCAIERLGAAAVREKLVGTTGAAAVVNVESGEKTKLPAESCEATR